MPDLPDVDQAWRADVAPYIAAMGEMIDATKAFRDEALAAVAEVQAALDGLHGGDVNIGVDAEGVGEAAAASEKLAKSASDAAGAETREAGAAHEAAGASRDAAGAGYDEAAAYRMVTEAMGSAAKATAALIFADEALAFASREAGAAAADEGHTASDALHGIIGAMQGANTPTRILGLSLSALHWIVGVSAEALAVLAPAMIAFGAGLAVAMQGANNAYNHMTALYGATEATNAAFGQTVGTTMHLKDALQQAQDAANPGVYEILGSAVNDTKAGMDTLATGGLQVVHMWDEFSARITVDMQQMAKSGQEQSLLGNMVSDLQELGQVLGNVGHALLNFASDMPGLAEVLLMIVDDISKAVLWISELPRPIIFAAMAMEEFYRWGGLLASVISRIGLVLPMIGPALLGAPIALFGRLAGIMGSVVGVAGQLVGGLAKMAGAIAGEDVPVIGALSGKLENLSKGMSEAASNTAMMGTLGLFAAAVVGAGIALDHFRNPAQQFSDSVNRAVAAASDMSVINVLASSIVATSQKINEQQAALSKYSPAMQHFADSNAKSTETLRNMEGPLAGAGQGAQNLNNKINTFIGTAFSALAPATGLGHAYEVMTGASGAGQAAMQASELNSEQQKLVGTFRTVSGNVSYLTHTYHISGAAAQAMAQEAGVNLQHALTGTSEAARVARQQIANLVTGLGAMSAPAGVVGNDMQAIGIQSQLADTKVSQLNQAWDAWISSVTGSMSAFSQVQTALGAMASDAGAKSAALSGAIGSVSLAGGQMTYTLKGMGSSAMQSWQQLTQAIGQGNSALDTLRTGMAEGVISGGNFKTTVQGLVGEMIPFVQGNKTATEMLSNLGHEAGGPVTTNLKQLEEWAGVKGKAAADQFASGMNNASQAMGDMSKVAQNLASVVSSDLDQALGASITKTSGVSQAVQKYSQDLSNAHTPASTLHADVQAISAAMARENQMTAAASKGINQAGNEAQTAAGKMHLAAVDANAFAGALSGLKSPPPIVISTVYTTSGAAANANPLLHPKGAHGGMVTGYGIIPSFAAGGILPGFSPGNDSLLAALSPGEAILNPHVVKALGAGTINWLNSAAWHGGGSGGGAGGAPAGGGGGSAPVNHVHVYLDGKQIWESMQQRTLSYNTRNSGGRSGSWAPGK